MPCKPKRFNCHPRTASDPGHSEEMAPEEGESVKYVVQYVILCAGAISWARPRCLFVKWFQDTVGDSKSLNKMVDLIDFHLHKGFRGFT